MTLKLCTLCKMFILIMTVSSWISLKSKGSKGGVLFYEWGKKKHIYKNVNELPSALKWNYKKRELSVIANFKWKRKKENWKLKTAEHT